MSAAGSAGTPILLLEDDPLLARSLSRALERRGCAPHVVATCAEARRELAAGPYELIIAELYAPDGNALDLLEALGRRRPAALIATTHELRTWRERAFAVGIEAYLPKPFPLRTLDRVLRCLLEGHRCLPRCSYGYTSLTAPKACPLSA